MNKPTLKQALKKEVNDFARRLKADLNSIEENQWNLGIVKAPIHFFLKSDFRPKVEWLPAPKNGTFRADPFVLNSESGQSFIFFEHYSDGKKLGAIHSIALGENCVPDMHSEKPSLSMPCHSSYPFVFERDGSVYCVPETYALRQIGLYKAIQLPDQWTKVATLVSDVDACDATLFEFDERWWMFYTDQAVKRDGCVFIYYSDNLLGPWHSHAKNPVKIDVSSSRPGGTPFMHEGVLYRPAQDCSLTYGKRVVINRVKLLTPQEFEEESAVFVEPAESWPYPEGLHTISQAGDFTVIDAKRRVVIKDSLKRLLIGGVLKLEAFTSDN